MSTKYVKVKDVSELKVGDTIRILHKPNLWASLLNPNCPLDKLSFPHTLKIDEMSEGR